MPRGIPGNRDTQTGKDLGNDTVTADYDGTTGTDLPQGADKFFLTSTELEAYGMLEHETYGWFQKPEVWAKGTGVDRVREVRRLGGRLVDDPSIGGIVDMQDLVLMFYPKKVKEAREKQDAADYAEYRARVDNDGAGYPDQFDPEDKARIKRNLAAVKQAHRDSGLIGPTRGNPAHWYKTITEETRVAEQERLRRGNRHHVSRTEAQATMADAARMGRKGQKSMVAPDMPRDAQGRLLRAK